MTKLTLVMAITGTWLIALSSVSILERTLFVKSSAITALNVPAPLVLDCGDISSTSDPTAQVIDWLEQATATSDCDPSPDISYDFDFSLLNLCAPTMYTITVTFTATDNCGGMASATSTITVIPDTQDPFITVPAPLVLDCGDISSTSDPTAQILDWLASASVSDNCDTDPELEYDFDFSLLNICAPSSYTITVTWTATDGCNNTSTATSSITVIPDTQDPFITIPAPLVLDCGDISATSDPAAQVLDWLASASVSDNCDTDPELEYDFDFSLLNICAPSSYTITVTWTATDGCNNTSTAMSSITVIPDTEDPSISAPAPLVLDCGDISATSDPAAQVADWLASASVVDNCDIDPELEYDFDFSLLNICAPSSYTITVTWTATDGCNNTSTAMSSITVIPDTEDPSITVPAPLVLDCGDISATSDPAAQVADWLASASVVDNCDTDPELEYDFDFSLLNICAPSSYTITVTWTATDGCNNTSTAMSSITVIPDTEDPSITVPAPLVLDCGDISSTSDPTAQVLDWLASASVVDNCDTDPELEYDFDFSLLNICAPSSYTITVTWTATDGCNNTSSAMSTITVIPDTEDPFIVLPAPLELDCDEAGDAADITLQILAWLSSVSVSDNCDPNPSLSYTLDLGSLDFCAPGSYDIEVTWTAADWCNNTTLLTSSIGVEICAPVDPLSIMCPADIYQQNDIDWCQARIEPDTPVIYVCSNIDENTIILTWSIDGAGATDQNGVPVTMGTGFVPALYFNVGISTVEYIVSAFDFTGNALSDTCSFTVTVVDKQKPELAGGFPLDEYVNCNAVPDPFPLTEDDFIDNCPGPLTVDFMEMSDQGMDPAQCDYYLYEITRIWKVTDQAGNMRLFEQNLFVTDTTAPEFTVNDVLISCDMVDMAPGIIDTSDNCAENAYLDIEFSDVSTQDPDMESCGHYTYTIFRTWTVTDPCGNAAVQLQTIEVQDIEPPVIECQDITIELDENGEAILSGNDILVNVMDNCAPDEVLTITVITQNGPLTCGDLGTAAHTVMVSDPCGNAAFCEVNVTVVDLLAPTVICPEPQTFNLDGGLCRVFLTPAELPAYDDNCMATITFDPPIDDGIPPGTHVIVATVTDQSGNSASCSFTIIVIEFDPPSGTVACNDQVQISLGADCQAALNADIILEGDDYRCYENYCLYTVGAQGDTVPDNILTLEHVGQCFTVTVQDCMDTQNSCWGVICVEEKLAPEISCPADITVSCNQSTDTDSTGVPVLLSCEGSVTMEFEDVIADNGDCGEPRAVLTRTWIVTDESANSSTCVQRITIEKFNPAILEFPEDIIAYSCNDVTADPDILLPENSGLPTLNGDPIFAGHYCEIFVGYWDETAIDANCPTNYALLRHWLVLDQCLPYDEGVNPVRHVQIIQVLDDDNPDIVCPEDITVTTDPWSCDASVNLPAPELYDACSEIVSYSVSASSGNLIHYGGSAYVLENLGVGTHTVTYVVHDQCNNIGYCTFEITVVDAIPPVPICDEHTIVTLTFDDLLDEGLTKIYAETFDDGSYDNCGPVTFLARRMDSCIDFDWIGPNGEYPNNDGGLPESIDRGLTFQPWVPFACCDIGTTVMVELRVTDVYGNINSCMVEVEVQDKLPPFIECPPDITVSCDYWFDAHETNGFEESDGLEAVFGRVLDAYDYEESDRQQIMIDDPGNTVLSQPHIWGLDGWADDNCDVEIDVRTRLFDDCSGDELPSGAPNYAVRLVERTFRAQDGQGNTSTCRQRIWVVDFDPFTITDTQCGLNNADDVRWPCDLTLTDCPQGELTPENLGDYAPNNAPQVNDDNCSLIGVTYEDQVFYFVDNACYKIIRTWTVIDWCQYDPVDLTGYWTYVQVIKVHDEEAPFFNPQCPDGPLTYCVADPEVTLPSNNQVFLGEGDPNSSTCSAHMNLSHVVTEFCSDYVIYDVKLYPFNGSEFIQVKAKTTYPLDTLGNTTIDWNSETSSLPANHPIRMYGVPYNDRYCSNWPLPGGEKDYHRILWTVEDGCGNIESCEYLFRLEDCKQPTPICVGLSSVVMPGSGSVTIWAKDFDSGSSVDDCTAHDDLLFSFSGDSYEPSRDFDCDAIEANGSPSFLLEIWVADEGNDQNCNGFVNPLGIEWGERNKDFCTTFIVIDDNEMVCGEGAAGVVETEIHEAVESVNVRLVNPSNGETMGTFTTGPDGFYYFINPLLGYELHSKRNDDPKNGVSTLDLVRIQKHLLGIQPLGSPYKLIAADVNNSQSVSALDLVDIRKLILGIYTKFPQSESWRFVNSGFVFEDPNHPWPFNEVVNISGMTSGHNFVAVKIGDVNDNVAANADQVVVREARRLLQFVTSAQEVTRGATIRVPVRASQFQQILGYQFALVTDGLILEGVEAGALAVTEDLVGVHSGIMTMSWSAPIAVTTEEVLFTLVFHGEVDGRLQDMLYIDTHSSLTTAEAYDVDEELLQVGLTFDAGSVVDFQEFALYQNVPNPVKTSTVIGFRLPASMIASLTIYDVNGRVIWSVEDTFDEGYHELNVNQRSLGAPGLYYYRLDAGDFSASRKMTVIQ